MTPKPPHRSAIAGCLLGGAIGDGLGGLYEGAASVVRDATVRALSLSDDTQMTMATCEAIVASGGIDPQQIAGAFVRWFRARRLTGLGSSTLAALRNLEAGSHWALAGASGERSAGNGAAMRIAPIAFLVDPTSAAGKRVVRDVASITHRNDTAYGGALAIALAIRFAAEGRDLETMHSMVAQHLPDTAVRDALLELDAFEVDAPLARVVERVGNSGYAAESVPLAIQGARRGRRASFGAILRAIVDVGGDTDTVASMCGQILGASLGRDALPLEDIGRLRDVDELVVAIDAFADAVIARPDGMIPG